MARADGYDFSEVTPRQRVEVRRAIPVRQADPFYDGWANEQERLLAEAQSAQWDNRPMGNQQLNIAPEEPSVLELNARQLAGSVETPGQMVAAGSVEPPLPVAGEDEPLPPVNVEGYDFSEVRPRQNAQGENFDFNGARPRRSASAVLDAALQDPMAGLDLSQVRPRQNAGAAVDNAAAQGYDFSQVRPRSVTDEEALAFRRGGETSNPEAKRLNLSFGGQEAALAQSVMRKPVTTPEAEDGTDVTFDKDGPAFKFTGALVIEPSTGPMATFDAARPPAPIGPVADSALQGGREAAMNQAPRLIPQGGQIVFDTSSPERFVTGVEQAFERGLLPTENYEKIKANSADIYRVVEDRRQLEEKAQADPRLLAALQGLGRGGAATLGAVGGAKAGAAIGAGVAGATGVGAPAIPVVAAVTGTAGAIVGGISAAAGYDAIYKKLGEHFERYDNVMKSAELFPQYNQAGQLTMAAVALPVSAVQGGRGLITAYQSGGAGQVARTAATAAGAGGVTGAVAYPIDAAVRGEEMTPGGFAAATGGGALMGGFFINNRMVRTPEITAIAQKIKAGQSLTAAELQIAKAASGPIQQAIGRADAAGGIRGKIDVEIPQSSVAGFMPSTGRASVRTSFYVPPKLPTAAVDRARTLVQGTRPTAQATPKAPAAPRSAEVNVLEPGTTPIAPPNAAMLGVEEFLARQTELRGIDGKKDFDAVLGLMDEHKTIVREAIDRNEAVSIDALDGYEIRVPYYDRDEQTGLATFNPETFTAWSQYVGSQGEEASEAMRQGGTDILDAIRESGGLPAKQSTKQYQYKGELNRIREAQLGGRDIGVKGVFNLFRKEAPDLDGLVRNLQGYGFQVQTPDDVFQLVERRISQGKPIYGYEGAAASELYQPAELAGRQPAAAPQAAPAPAPVAGPGKPDWSNVVSQANDISIQEFAQLASRGQLRPASGRLAPFPVGTMKTPLSLGSAEGYTLEDIAHFYVSRRTPGLLAPDPRNPAASLPQTSRALNMALQSAATDPATSPTLVAAFDEFMADAAAELASGKVKTAPSKQKPATGQRSARTAAPRPAVSSDPFTPPAAMRAGGPAKVPPGVPVGMQAMQPPDWVVQPGETSEGRRLIKGVQNFQTGQKWGFRAIVDHVNDAVRLEMRRSQSQTSNRHPAHYRPANHMAYTRSTQSQINFHEAGHGLEYLIRARVPNFFDSFAGELIALTQRPGSMASDPPAESTPAQAQQYRIGEGVAEWTRLLMVDPASVMGMRVTDAINQVAERFYPGMAKSLRDGARAVNAFQAKPAADRWAMFNSTPNANPSANDFIGAIIRGGESAVNAIASGAPVSSLDRKITRAIIKQRQETETAYKAAVSKAQQVRATNLTPLMSAYNMVLSIGAETQLAISGQGPSKGLRALGADGQLRYFTKDTWRDLRRKVPNRFVARFDEAAWAKESLNRWENGRLEYPGMREGITPDDLRAIVERARREIPNFDAMYAEQSKFHDTLLELKEFGQLVSAEERARITGARDGYWPLPRVMTAGRGGKGGGNINAGIFRARGSGEAIRNIDEVTEQRVRETFEAYYWNRFGLKLADHMAAVAKDTSLPMEARRIAGATITKLKVPMEAVASVSREEALGWVMKAVGDAYEKVLGFRPEITADDVNLSWNFRDVWRPTSPKDANVVSLLRDGKREYYQLGDPAMFGLFANPQMASKAGKLISWATGPMTENWKRNITQGTVFALRNFVRDAFSQPLMNPDPAAWLPFRPHYKGVINKFTLKYPQVFSEGLLLSRIEPSSTELVNSIRHGAIWQWLTDGLYVSQAKDPVVRTIATVLQPSNWLMLFPLTSSKMGDLINAVTPGATVGGMIGGLPGAAIGAVVGPAVGLTGSRISQFLESAGREGAAVMVLERGGTDEEALARYWTAAGQFNEHAGVMDARIAMRIPGFLNPMVQGLRNQTQRLTDPDPEVRGRMWARLLLLIPSLSGGAAAATYLFMTREDKERERQRPVDERMNFMNIGGFSVPFPFGLEGALGSIIYNAVMDDLLDRPKVDAERTALMLLKRVADPGGMLQFFGPQLATLQEAQMNWSVFRQKHIVAPWMVNLPPSEQYYSTTPEFYRKAGEWLNYSPAKLQYIMQQAVSRQTDETIRFMESIDRGRPIMEAADVPFVGRLFVRDPIGFGSQAVRNASNVEDKLRLLDTRLKAKGWNVLRDPQFPAAKVGSVQLRQLQMQLQYLDGLRKGLRTLDDMQGVAKFYALRRDFANERNVRVMQTQFTQSLLLSNTERIEVLEQALELLKEIPQAPAEQVAQDYLQRRF